MSRWGRGRSGVVAVPLDSALFRENSNCPSAARSAGTVGKWGITSFTSIRNAPYAYSSLAKKSVQDQNSPLTVPAVETEQPPPKPKKFFKSRNAEPYPPVPQITYAPPVEPAPLSPEHASTTKDKRSHKKNRSYNRDSSSPELPRRNSEKTKVRKNSIATKAAKKEQPLDDGSQPPNKRYLVRNRNKVINYAEDGSNSPIPDFTARFEPPPLKPASSPKISSPLKVPSPKTSPLISSPGPIKLDVASPSTSKEANEERKPPPIVLRISKGTSRIVSTDSNEGFTSPSSDRHSSMDIHSDVGSEHKKSPLMETICSPKHEGLKITIKCAGLSHEGKKEKKKDKKDGHKSHKRHHKTVNEEPVKKASSPLPGSDAYELYRTLASPAHEIQKEIKNPADDIESQLAKLDSGDSLSDSAALISSAEMSAEPKPQETVSARSRRNMVKTDITQAIKSSNLDEMSADDITSKSSDNSAGRARRNRRNVNYNENDDYLDVLTTRYSVKTVGDLKREGRKVKKKADEIINIDVATVAKPVEQDTKNVNADLINILSGSCDTEQAENNTLKLKIHKKQKIIQNKHLSTATENPVQLKRNKKQKHLISAYVSDDSHDNDTLAKYVKKVKHRKQKDKKPSPVSDSEEEDEALATYVRKTKQENPTSVAGGSQETENLSGSNENLDYHSENEYQESGENQMQNDLSDVADSDPDHGETSSKNNVKNAESSSENESQKRYDNLEKTKVAQEEVKETIVENNNIVNTESCSDVQSGENSQTANSQSADSAYNSHPNENSEEESQKQEDTFKVPNEMSDTEDPSEGKPSVKLVITKKKGSIFKSKSLVNDNPSPLPARKRRHLYKHQWANDKGNETPRPERPENAEVNNAAREVPEELTRVTKYRSPDPIADDEAVKPYTSVRCAKEAKEYYTVVRNVKKAHQIQEIGEFQEFNDDVEYLLDALQDNNPNSTRCLSAITLATKCMAPAFRMHLRAHGTVQKFFSSLHDATNDQSLGLCTATVMFVLSQDRLNMDMDRESLELMLNLLESDASHKNALDDCGLTSAQLTKTQERVRELCAEIKSQGKGTHLNLDNITVGHLAMETLLSLTSKRAGEWFKEELRVLGGVDHIVRTIQDCASRLEAPASSWTPTDVDVLRKADRCMRVLENVTQQNEDNQLYLVGESLGAARTLAWLFCRCAGEARLYPHLREPLLEAALPALKVLVNLSHSFGSTASLGAQVVGEQPSVMEVCLVILNNQGSFIPDSKNFEFSVCVLLLLINLVQNNEANTQRLLNVRIRVDSDEDIISRSLAALDLIVELFYKREELARRAEENTDALLDGEKDADSDKDKKKQQDDIDETVAKLLSRAGTHMEHTMVCAYIALLLGHMAVVSPAHAATVRARVPSYAPLLPTLNKYYTFLSLTASAEAAIVAHVKATHRIIKFMEECDKVPPVVPSQPSTPYSVTTPYYETSPSDMPQDMSLSNLNYMNCSTSSSDRMSSSMEVDGYH